MLAVARTARWLIKKEDGCVCTEFDPNRQALAFTYSSGYGGGLGRAESPKHLPTWSKAVSRSRLAHFALCKRDELQKRQELQHEGSTS
jgi:hypothetical protein